MFFINPCKNNGFIEQAIKTSVNFNKMKAIIANNKDLFMLFECGCR